MSRTDIDVCTAPTPATLPKMSIALLERCCQFDRQKCIYRFRIE